MTQHLLRAACAAWSTIFALAGCNPSDAPANDSGVEGFDVNNDQRDVSGGQTSDGTGVAQAAGGCATERATIELDGLEETVAELGFAPADVLDWVAGGVDASLSWAPLADVMTAPESGTGSIHLSFEYADGVRFFDGTIGVNEGEEAFGECPPWIELDVVVELSTPGGALDERFPATLRAARPKVVDLFTALDLDALEGALELDSVEIDPPFQSLVVLGTLTELGSYGRITAHPEAVTPEQAVGSLGAPIAIVAMWPAATGCAPPPTPSSATSNLNIDEELALSGRSVESWLRFFDDLPPLSLRWEDGAETGLELLVTPTSTACYSNAWLEGTVGLDYAVQITAQTEDASWAGQYQGFAATEISESGEAWASLNASQTVALEELAALGVPQALDAAESAARTGGSIEQGRLRLRLGFGSGDDAPVGELRIEGLRVLDCDDPDAQTQDECLSSLEVNLARATISDGATGALPGTTNQQ